ncbi:hypothetical protein BCR35DRAFT_336500 [Leucosporidium creatinivorum]|uniref:Uncharacterized protein n=1 Tax=Leucosporidium creatinivorum TaxID=106004 RepID=A0A1Y2C0M1_9BASI|nr:hypothetical protein BCR35DRAFT_336500 [Leucosporidium creatinivorum]
MPPIRTPRPASARRNRAPYSTSHQADVAQVTNKLKADTLYTLEDGRLPLPLLIFKASLSITLPESSRFHTPTPLLFHSEHGRWFQTRDKAREGVAEVAVDHLLEMMGRSFDELDAFKAEDCLKDSLYPFLRVARTMRRWICSAGMDVRFAAAMVGGMQRVGSLSWKDLFTIVKSLVSREGAEDWARKAGEQLYAEGRQVLLGPLLAAQVQAVEEVFRERGWFDLKALCGDRAAQLAGNAHDQAQQLLVNLLARIIPSVSTIFACSTPRRRPPPPPSPPQPQAFKLKLKFTHRHPTPPTPHPAHLQHQ